MSRWTHITSCMSVDTFRCSKTLVEEVQQYLEKAPKITGSEKDAEVFVNLKSGHNFYTSQDCEHCEYQDMVYDVEFDGEIFKDCDVSKGHDCSATYQTCVVISIQGDLRDKGEIETKEEFEKFKKYVEDKYMIRDYSVNIIEE